MKERRRFKRYNHETKTTIRINDNPFDAKIVDYSVDGLGLVLEDHPVVEKGDTLTVKLENPRIVREAVVMWMRNQRTVTRLGLLLNEPTEGALDDFQISDVLLGLQRSLKTGTLEIRSGNSVKTIYLKNGDIVFAASNLKEDGFADLLLKKGKLTKTAYDMLMDLQGRTGKKQGTLLVETGILKPQELVEFLKIRVEEIVLSVFSFEEGVFHFIERPLPPDEILPLKLSTATIIYRGFKSIYDLRRLQKECPADDDIVGLSSDPLDLFQDLKLAVEDKTILSLIDGKTTAREVLAKSPLGIIDSLQSIAALFGTRMIEIKEEPEADEVKLEEVLEEHTVDSEEVLKKIDEMYDTCLSRDFFVVLGVGHSSGNEEVKKAYYRMAKEFHPDIHYNLAADVNLKLTVIFSQISTAFATLKTAEGRERYRKTLKNAKKEPSKGINAMQKFKEGLAFFGAGDIKRAESLFAEAAYLDDSNPEYHYNLGIAHFRLDKFKDAEREIRKAYMKDPKNPDILAELGHVYIRLGLPARAKGNLERAISFKPSHKRALDGLKALDNLTVK